MVCRKIPYYINSNILHMFMKNQSTLFFNKWIRKKWYRGFCHIYSCQFCSHNIIPGLCQIMMHYSSYSGYYWILVLFFIENMSLSPFYLIFDIQHHDMSSRLEEPRILCMSYVVFYFHILIIVNSKTMGCVGKRI